MLIGKIIAQTTDTTPIKDSVFNFYKVIVGPSSSHTAGVYKIGTRIREHLLQLETLPTKITLEFCNSLSATGKGHYSDIALAGALSGQALSNLAYYKNHFEPERPIEITGTQGSCTIIPAQDFIFSQQYQETLPANTLIASFYNNDICLAAEQYESIGGGRIRPDVAPRLDEVTSAYQFNSWESFTEKALESEKTIIDFILRREELLHDTLQATLFRKMENILDIMLNAVARGLTYSPEAALPSGILHYRASLLMEDALKRNDLYSIAGAAAMAASEHNASMGEMITAPTAGGGGVLPGILYALNNYGIAREKLVHALFVAGLLGQIIEYNSCVSGAKAGCTFEIGVAAAMAASAGVYALGPQDTLENKSQLLLTIEHAAQEIFAHYPNLPCDPIRGLVQIPCIERNKDFAIIAMGKIFSTLAPNPYYVSPLPFDLVLQDAYQKGLQLPREYRETSLGGLATLPLKPKKKTPLK